MAAGHADDPTRGADHRPGEFAALDRVAHAEFDVILAAAIAHRNDAGAQGGLGTFQRLEGELCRAELGLRGRSEEHTSELQSLMRISYAVFCLKKKKK